MHGLRFFFVHHRYVSALIWVLAAVAAELADYDF